MKRITYLLFMLCLSLWSLHAMGQTIKVDDFSYSVNKDGEHTLTLLQIPRNEEHVAIPANVDYGGNVYTVTKIESDAVSFKENLKTLSIPATVNKILDQMYAFERCDLLESITVDEGNESYFSQDGAIYDKNTLALLRLPKCVRGKVTLVDGMTDNYGSKRLDLEKMPNVEEIVFAGGLESISMNGMPSLKSATFPSSVSSLDIKECPVLDKVSVAAGGVYSSADGVLYRNSEIYHNDGYVKGREIVFLPETRTEYIMPSDVVSVPDRFFVSCENLISLSVDPSNGIFESEGNAVYEDAEGTEGRVLVDAAGGLSEIVLPADIAGIKETDVPVDDDLFEPHHNVPVMYAMKKLASVSMPVPNENYMTADGVLMKMLTEYDMPEGGYGWSVIFVPQAIEGKVVLPEGTVNIAPSAFYGTAITSVTIPDGCMVSYAAFAHCGNLSDVVFTGDASAESTAFYGTPWLINHEPGVLYAGTTAIGLAGTPKEIVIRDGTKTIGKEAFTPFVGHEMSVGGASLEKVTLPEGLEKIERYAFLNCGNLKSVNIPSTLKSVEGNVFGGCHSLADVTLGEGLSFMPDIYADAVVRNVYVPASVERWEAMSFGEELESIEVSPDNNVFASQGGILYDKEKIFVLMVPPALVNADIPEGCVSIGMAPTLQAKQAVKAPAYENMPYVSFGERLKTVSLPSTLQYIYGYDVFTNCSELKECRVFNSTPIEIGEYTFPDDLSGVRLYVPEGSEDAYRNAAEWSRFGIIEGFDTTGIGDSAVSEKPYETSRYSLDGRRLQAPEKGVNIVRMSDGSVHKVVVK